jgi:hypothetical protein
MGPEFFQTIMGRKFYEADVPRIAKALENIAVELKRSNDLKEKEKELQMIGKVEDPDGTDPGLSVSDT